MSNFRKTAEEKSKVASFELQKVSAEIAVRKATRFETSLNIIMSLLLSFVGGVGFVAELGLLHVSARCSSNFSSSRTWKSNNKSFSYFLTFFL